jgi:hypothetical protein
MNCAICTAPVDHAKVEPFRMGAVVGVVCEPCFGSWSFALAEWMRERLRTVAAERLQAERCDQANERRFQQLNLEVMPKTRARLGGRW